MLTGGRGRAKASELGWRLGSTGSDVDSGGLKHNAAVSHPQNSLLRLAFDTSVGGRAKQVSENWFDDSIDVTDAGWCS